MATMVLCGKEYEYKMHLGAIKHYHDETGRDLWCDMLNYINVFLDSKKLPPFKCMANLYESIPFERAAILFHALIKGCDKSISLQEIKDGMFRVGWTPDDSQDELSEPYPIVLYKVAIEINTEMGTFHRKKK